MSKIFIDTNILIYASDQNDPKKQKKARKALKQLQGDSTGVVSTQILQEFYVAATKKLGMAPLAAKSIFHSFENFEIAVVDIPLIKEAIDCSILNPISFWDALILASAESAKCEALWSEDLNHGQTINSVRIEKILLP